MRFWLGCGAALSPATPAQAPRTTPRITSPAETSKEQQDGQNPFLLVKRQKVAEKA